MNKIKLNIDKNKKYVVACSFGPDSMALLASAVNEKLDIIVAHVNYRKREASTFEQQELQRYCDERKIRFYVLDLLGEKHKGNFQEWAREKRYKFFKTVIEKESAYGVLVAHQQDDLIETYLMQKNRGNISKFAGISSENDLFGIKIIRPLLQYSKEELREFDDKNHIPYSIDESNLTDAYTRNKIRHHIVEKMTKEEKAKLLDEIRQSSKAKIEFKTIWDKCEFQNLSYEQIVTLLDFYMTKVGEHTDLSKRYVGEIKKAFHAKRNCSFEITTSIKLEADYEDVFIVNRKRIADYFFEFNGKLDNEIFDIDFSSRAEDRKITNASQKLIVKNVKAYKRTVIRNYSVDIKRLFIDWKMPHYLRDVWPGIFDENGQLLYIPRYRKQFVDNHKSKFVFRTEYFTDF